MVGGTWYTLHMQNKIITSEKVNTKSSFGTVKLLLSNRRPTIKKIFKSTKDHKL